MVGTLKRTRVHVNSLLREETLTPACVLARNSQAVPL